MIIVYEGLENYIAECTSVSIYTCYCISFVHCDGHWMTFGAWSTYKLLATNEDLVETYVWLRAGGVSKMLVQNNIWIGKILKSNWLYQLV